MKRIAIIPARGGSKRIIGKNLYMINGLPLIAHTIVAASAWGKFDHIYINSDEDKILDCAEQYGAEKYIRPYQLAVDTAKVIDVIKEQINTLALQDDIEIAILLPTCPLRTLEDIENTYKLFIENGSANSVISVTEYEKAPEQAFYINKQGALQRKFPGNYSSRSQDHSEAYRYNTAIIYTSAGLFRKHTDIVGSSSIPYIMPYERSIDIDYDYHIRMVELIMKQENCGD